jgi:plastocyanin
MTRMIIIAALAALSSVAEGQAVNVTVSEWKVALSRDTVRAGSVTFRVKNAGSMTHGFYVRGEGVDKGSRDIEARQEGSLTVTLKPGTYEVFCPMADLSHKAAGMSRKLVVVPDDKPAEAKKPGV